MVRLRNSNECYSSSSSLVADLKTDIDRISTVLVRSRIDYLDDCRQTLYVHAIESHNDSSSTLNYQQLVNKMWWRAMDFVKRDPGVNFWKVHIPFSDDVSSVSIHPKVIGRYVQNPGAEAKVDIEKIIDYASRTCSERDFVVFILSVEGLSILEISNIIYPDSGSSLQSTRRIKSALWRMRNRFKVVLG